MPDKVSLGDRVWVDENANGIQDAKETKVPGGTATFMLVPSMEGEEGNILYTQANEDGYYSFEHLNLPRRRAAPRSTSLTAAMLTTPASWQRPRDLPARGHCPGRLPHHHAQQDHGRRAQGQ